MWTTIGLSGMILGVISLISLIILIKKNDEKWAKQVEFLRIATPRYTKRTNSKEQAIREFYAHRRI